MPETSQTEQARVDALVQLNLLDTAAERQFDEITRLATLVVGVRSSAISLIDDRRQWFTAFGSLLSAPAESNVRVGSR